MYQQSWFGTWLPEQSLYTSESITLLCRIEGVASTAVSLGLPGAHKIQSLGNVTYMSAMRVLCTERRDDCKYSQKKYKPCCAIIVHSRVVLTV